MVLSCTKYGHLDPYLFADLMAIIRLHSQLQIISILTRYFICCKSETYSQIKVFRLFKNVIPLPKSVKTKGTPSKCILLYSVYCEQRYIINQLVKMYLKFDDIVPIVLILCKKIITTNGNAYFTSHSFCYMYVRSGGHWPL